MNPGPPYPYYQPPRPPSGSNTTLLLVILGTVGVAVLAFGIAVDQGWVNWKTPEEREAERYEVDDSAARREACIRDYMRTRAGTRFSDGRSVAVHAVEECP